MIYYKENKIKNQRKLPILFIHGLKGTHRGMIDIARSMSDYHWFLPDMPGHGQSDLMNLHGIETYAKALLDFMHKRDINKFLVVGHSYGGNVAVELARLAGPKVVPKMVTIAPYPGYKNTPTNLAFGSMYAFIKYFPRPIVNFFLLGKIAVFVTGLVLYKTSDRERVKALQKQGYHEETSFEKRVMVEAVESLREFDLRSRLNELKQPTLLVYGDIDSFAKLNGIESEIKNSKISVVPYKGGGHLIPLEYPERVSALVRGWIEP
ncbi:MAG: alpha/beta hydrolase [Patescibacteria group bacterium]|nr:alpha/beta hydrolase [Patescibacteria group bacterium]